MKTNKTGQGTIEYLVILAVIVVVSLIVVGLMISSTSGAAGVSSGTSKVAGWTNTISVTESAISPDGNYLVRLANNTGEPLTIKTVKVGDEEVNFSEDLFQGSQQSFKVSSEVVCEIGQTITSELVVTYVTENGLEKTETYPLDVAFACDDYVVSLLANQCPDASGTDTSDANATTDVVLKGYDFYSLGGTLLDGTLTIASRLHSKQARCFKTDNTEVACGSADGNTVYQDARLDGNVASFTNLGTGTVRDNFTGLVWQKGSSEEMTWYNALGYCALLANGIGGVTDGSVAGTWRVPSVLELMTFIDYNCSAVSANCSGAYMNIEFTAPSEWGNCMAGYCGYWSSTTVPSPTGYAYSLHSESGGITSPSKSLATYSGVRCVRFEN